MKKSFILFFLLLSTISKAQTKEDILKYHFEKMGAPEKWLSINTFRKESTTIYGNSLLSSRTSEETKYCQKPALTRIESKSKNNNNENFFIVASDSLGTWQKINNADVERISKYSTDFTQADMTIFLTTELKNKNNIQLKPNEFINGEEYYVLEVKNNRHIRRLLYINMKTYMIDIYTSVDYDGKSSNATATHLSDYRRVNGFLFPFQSEIPLYGTKMITTDIQINIPIDNKIFSPEGK